MYQYKIGIHGNWKIVTFTFSLPTFMFLHKLKVCTVHEYYLYKHIHVPKPCSMIVIVHNYGTV